MNRMKKIKLIMLILLFVISIAVTINYLDQKKTLASYKNNDSIVLDNGENYTTESENMIYDELGNIVLPVTKLDGESKYDLKSGIYYLYDELTNCFVYKVTKLEVS